MSSYLNIYLKKKDTHEYLYLEDWSRNSEVYQYVNDNINPAWASNEDKYTDVTIKDLDTVIHDIAKEKKATMDRLNSYKEYLGKLVDYIDPDCPEAPKPKKGVEDNTEIWDCLEQIQWLKEEYNDLDDAQKYIDFLYNIQANCENECIGDYPFECISFNIS